MDFLNNFHIMALKRFNMGTSKKCIDIAIINNTNMEFMESNILDVIKISAHV